MLFPLPATQVMTTVLLPLNSSWGSCWSFILARPAEKVLADIFKGLCHKGRDPWVWNSGCALSGKLTWVIRWTRKGTSCKESQDFFCSGLCQYYCRFIKIKGEVWYLFLILPWVLGTSWGAASEADVVSLGNDVSGSHKWVGTWKFSLL